MQVKHWQDLSNEDFSEAIMAQKLRDLGYRVTRYVYMPGTSFPPHVHDRDKIDAILSGHFRLEMEGESVVMSGGDFVEIPRHKIHSAEVLGSEPVVSLDAVKI